MRPTITVFACSPDKGAGLARDMRVRWALEEVGQPYDVRPLSMVELKEPAHRARNPFGSIPTYEEGELTLFESGAIVLHIAQTRPGLLPDDEISRSRAIAWLFAALNTIEPPIIEHEMARFFENDKVWRDEHLAMIVGQVHHRLEDLSAKLGQGDWLEREFSVADLMMVLTLRRLEGSGIVESYPNLAAYVARGVARPAYTRAFAAQAAVFASAAAR